jgi:hypothetical protein
MARVWTQTLEAVKLVTDSEYISAGGRMELIESREGRMNNGSAAREDVDMRM